MPFVRVTSADPADPQHAFDVSVDEATVNAALYRVIDAEPVEQSRPAEYVEPRPARPAAPRKPRAPRKTTSRRTATAAAVPPVPEGDKSLDDTQKENG